MPIPVLQPPAPTAVVAPYLMITVDGRMRRLSEDRLQRLLCEVTGASSASSSNDWVQFAQNNGLVVGTGPLVTPAYWLQGKDRWVAVSRPTKSEAHLYYGFVKSAHPLGYTHLDVAKDAKRWLPRLARAATLRRHILFHRPVVDDFAMVASHDSGISVSSRQALVKTLLDKESVIFFLAIGGASIENSKSGISMSGLIDSFKVVVFAAILVTLVRHFIILPPVTWAVEKLKD